MNLRRGWFASLLGMSIFCVVGAPVIAVGMVGCISELPSYYPGASTCNTRSDGGSTGPVGGDLVFDVSTKNLSRLSTVIIKNYYQELLLDSVRILDGTLFRSEIPKGIRF
jgi:hypothetical protein